MARGRGVIGRGTRGLVLILGLWVAGCDDEPQRVATTTAPVNEATVPTAGSPATAPVATPATPTAPTSAAGWTVAELVDGDTLWVATADGARAEVRLIGVDTPERGACFAEEATLGLQFFAAAGTAVQLVSDTSDTGRYGRQLRYVEVVAGDGSVVDVGAELVGAGFAVAKRYPPDTARADIYELRQAEAQQLGRGQWAPGACAAPPPVTSAPFTAAPVTAPPPLTAPPAIVPFATIPTRSNDCHPAYLTVCIPGGRDLDCGDVTARRFEVVPPDPHGFDGDHDGIGCEGG